MSQGGDYPLQHIPHGNAQGGGVLAGMQPQIGLAQKGTVQNQLHGAARVLEQAQKAGGAGLNSQKPGQILFPGKAQAAAAQLSGKMLGFEYLVPFQQQKIELGFLPVAQEEVFGNGGLQNRLHLVAGLNVKGRAVVHPAIGDAQAVQKVIASHFRRAPPLTVPGAAGVAGLIQFPIHGKPPQYTMFKSLALISRV